MASERRRAYEEHEFDQIERLTNRVVRGAAVGVPVWILLLGLLPFTGLGVGACLLGATVVAVAAVVLVERLRGRRAAGDAGRAAGGRRVARGRMSPLAAAGLTLGVVLVIVYVIFVVRAA